MDSSTTFRPATASAAAAPASVTTSPGDGRRPAWREPLVWLVAGIPALTVVAGVATLLIASHGADVQVGDQIRKHGLAVSRLIERDDAARRLGVHATLSMSASGAMSVRIDGDASALPPVITLRLLDPARANADMAVRLAREPGVANLYRGEVDAALVGARAWLASVETERWRLDRRGVTTIGVGAPIGFEPKPSAGARDGSRP
ncbi:MAG: FixH family protein [Lautropia sp.]